MTAIADPPSVTAQAAQALELHETASIAIEEGASSPIAADGTVLVHIIRPGIGKGKGRHVYEANMLEEHAPMFAGQAIQDRTANKPWKMYADHRSTEAKKAAGGLPRSLRDVAGIIKESWWDGDVPADAAAGFGQGAVVAKVKPVPWVRELIETDPELVETSISAQATSVRPVTRGNQRAWLVEGIRPKGSVDFVTEAGAGGRVAPLLEGFAEDSGEMGVELIEAMDDDDFREWIAETRPTLLEALRSEPEKPTPTEDDDVADITPEALAEALASSPDVLVKALQSDTGKAAITALVEGEIADVTSRSQATVSRVIQLARLERAAHEQIDATKLPETWKTGLKERYALLESGEPTESLDVFDETGEFGQVTKPAREVLREALETDITAEQTKLREARPTLVRGQGGRGAELQETEDGDGKPKPIEDAAKTGWGRYLKTAGVDPAGAFHLTGAAEK